MTADLAQLEVNVVGTDDQELVQPPMGVTDRSPNPEQVHCGSELREILIKSLEKMSPMPRVVFVVGDVEKLSTDQTAEALSLGPRRRCVYGGFGCNFANV